MEYKSYVNMVNSPEYIELHRYYTQETTWDVLGVARQENPHSSFLRWLLDSSSTHGLEEYPIRKLIETLICAKEELYDAHRLYPVEFEPENAWAKDNALYIDKMRYGQYQILDLRVANEIVLNKQRRADIFAAFTASFTGAEQNALREKKTIVIVIENKIHSGEHDGQTVDYAETALTDKRKDALKALYHDDQNYPTDPAIVFLSYLTPYESETISCAVRDRKKKGLVGVLPASEQFLPLNYQYLLDGMITPCLASCQPGLERDRISDYIRCLGQARLDNPQSDNTSKSDDYLVMAISKEERIAVQSLWQQHGETIREVLGSLEMSKSTYITAQERPFWIALTNVLCMIGDSLEKKDGEDVKSLLASAKAQFNLSAKKHLFRYQGQEYTTRGRQRNNMGWLCRNILVSYITENGLDSNAIIALRTALQKISTTWLGEMIFFDDELTALRNGNYQPAPGTRYPTKSLDVFVDDYFCEFTDAPKTKNSKKPDLQTYNWKDDDRFSVQLTDGHRVYIARWWSSDSPDQIINILKNEFGYIIEQFEQVY